MCLGKLNLILVQVRIRQMSAVGTWCCECRLVSFRDTDVGTSFADPQAGMATQLEGFYSAAGGVGENERNSLRQQHGHPEKAERGGGGSFASLAKC